MRRKEQAEASKAALLEAARSVFAEAGFDGATVAEILARAGMARGALYHYYPGGKRALFEAVFDAVNESYHRLRDAHVTEADPLVLLRGGIRAFLTMCTEDDFARIALVDAPRLVDGQADRGSSYALLLDQLTAAVATGQLVDVDPESQAMALYGAVRSAGDYVTNAGDRSAAAATASRILDLFIDGLLLPGPKGRRE